MKRDAMHPTASVIADSQQMRDFLQQMRDLMHPAVLPSE
jgi:hypothetical protein